MLLFKSIYELFRVTYSRIVQNVHTLVPIRYNLHDTIIVIIISLNKLQYHFCSNGLCHSKIINKSFSQIYPKYMLICRYIALFNYYQFDFTHSCHLLISTFFSTHVQKSYSYTIQLRLACMENEYAVNELRFNITPLLQWLALLKPAGGRDFKVVAIVVVVFVYGVRMLYLNIYHATQRSHSSTILKCINSLFIISVALIRIYSLVSPYRPQHHTLCTTPHCYIVPPPKASFMYIPRAASSILLYYIRTVTPLYETIHQNSIRL